MSKKYARLSLYFVYNGFKRGRVVQRQISQCFAVEGDFFLSERVDKSAVAQPFRTRGGIDARNPEAAIKAFFVFAVAISVLPTLFQGILGNGVHFGAGTEVAACG